VSFYKKKKRASTPSSGRKPSMLVIPDLSSTLRSRKHRHSQLALLGSPPDAIPKNINPAGQDVTVQAKTRTGSKSRLPSFGPAMKPVCSYRVGLILQPSLPASTLPLSF